MKVIDSQAIQKKKERKADDAVGWGIFFIQAQNRCRNFFFQNSEYFLKLSLYMVKNS